MKRVLMTAHKGFETLDMSELVKEHPAVRFDQAEGVELSFRNSYRVFTKSSPTGTAAHQTGGIAALVHRRRHSYEPKSSQVSPHAGSADGLTEPALVCAR
jgi:hypothetical protein